MNNRRINILGRPGSGKSTLALFLVSELTIADYHIQLVDEYVKTWAYKGQSPRSFDQCYLFAKQLHKEDVFLSSGVDLIVSDCPLSMICAYVHRSGLPFFGELVSLTQKFDKVYPSINLLLDPDNIPYKKEGRFETEEQARHIGALIEKVLQDHFPNFLKVKTQDRQDVLKTILASLKE